MTVDAVDRRAVTEIPDELTHRFLDAIQGHRGALNVRRPGHAGLAVTVSIHATELEEPTMENAAARGEALVREHLTTIGEEWVVVSVEVSDDAEHGSVAVLCMAETEKSR